MSKAENLVHAGQFKYAWAEEMASIAKSDLNEREPTYSYRYLTYLLLPYAISSQGSK